MPRHLALAAFVVASIHEDTYGQVQHEVPAILDTMASYFYQLAALESEMLQQARARDESMQATRSKVVAKVEEGRRIASGEKQEQAKSSDEAQQTDSAAEGQESGSTSQGKEQGGHWWQDSVRQAWSEEAADVQKSESRCDPNRAFKI